eukprot:1627167-Rhodomonas_salina.1
MAYELLTRGQQRYWNEIAPFNLEESKSYCVQTRYPFLAKCKYCLFIIRQDEDLETYAEAWERMLVHTCGTWAGSGFCTTGGEESPGCGEESLECGEESLECGEESPGCGEE